MAEKLGKSPLGLGATKDSGAQKASLSAIQMMEEAADLLKAGKLPEAASLLREAAQILAQLE
jgi:hypothetical protein